MTHTDHPSRHYDRTCPACEQQPDGTITHVDPTDKGIAVLKDSTAEGNPATDPQEEPKPVGEVSDMKYGVVHFYGNPLGGRPEGYLHKGTKLYTRPQHDRVKELEGVEMLNGLQAQSIGILSKELDEAEAKIAEQAARITHLETCFATAISTGMDKIANLTAQRDRLVEAVKEVLRTSDRKHDAWDAAKAVLAEITGEQTK